MHIPMNVKKRKYQLPDLTVMNGCVNYLFSGYNTYLNELNTYLQSLEQLIFPLFGNVKAFTHIRKTRISYIFQLC